jgi:phosphoribosylanthranilate isomerase
LKVKICGIKRVRDALFAAKSGADAIGCIVNISKSPRNVDIDQAKKIFDSLPPFVSSVAVLYPESMDYVIDSINRLQPSAVQIHGNNLKFHEIEKLSRIIKQTKLIQSLAIDTNTGTTNCVDSDPLKAALKLSSVIAGIHIDSSVNGVSGGTGRCFNWSIAKTIKEQVDVPIILAGGLKPSNVAEGITYVKPFAVDVSSGVEARPGVKSYQKIREFIQRSKEA